MKEKKSPNIYNSIRLGQMALSLGINFALWSFVGYFLGSKLDERLGTDPWLMISGILLGIGISFYGFIKEIIVISQIESNKKHEDD